jgi:hypothetical protein
MIVDVKSLFHSLSGVRALSFLLLGIPLSAMLVEKMSLELFPHVHCEISRIGWT